MRDGKGLRNVSRKLGFPRELIKAYKSMGFILI